MAGAEHSGRRAGFASVNGDRGDVWLANDANPLRLENNRLGRYRWIRTRSGRLIGLQNAAYSPVLSTHLVFRPFVRGRSGFSGSRRTD